MNVHVASKLITNFMKNLTKDYGKKYTRKMK